MTQIFQHKIVSLFIFYIIVFFSINNSHSQQEKHPIEPISIIYTVSLKSKKLGNATLGKLQTSLSKTNQGYSVHSITKAQGLAAILLGSNMQESCDFSINNNRVVSHKYSGGRKDKLDYESSFDWQQHKITFEDNKTLVIPNDGYLIDNCNMPVAASLLRDQALPNEALYVLDGKKKIIRTYRFKSSEKEILKTKLGDLDTIKITLERGSPNNTKSFTLWLSKQHSYMPIKMEDKRNSRTTTMLVDKIEPLS